MSHVLSPPSRCSTMRSSRRYPPAPPVFCPPAVFPNPEFLGLFQEGRRGIGRTPRGAHGAHELRLEAMFRRHRKELLNSSAPFTASCLPTNKDNINIVHRPPSFALRPGDTRSSAGLWLEHRVAPYQ